MSESPVPILRIGGPEDPMRIPSESETATPRSVSCGIDALLAGPERATSEVVARASAAGPAVTYRPDSQMGPWLPAAQRRPAAGSRGDQITDQLAWAWHWIYASTSARAISR
jgi:hypothetical protein